MRLRNGWADSPARRHHGAPDTAPPDWTPGLLEDGCTPEEVDHFPGALPEVFQSVDALCISVRLQGGAVQEDVLRRTLSGKAEDARCVLVEAYSMSIGGECSMVAASKSRQMDAVLAR